jgi:hypothetical protein
MSMRTIVEFNHDYAHKIADDPAEFAAWLDLALKSGDQRRWDELERYGVKRAVMAHHSDDRKAVVGGKDYVFP